MISDRQTLSILQACAHVGVSRRTINNWINSGKEQYVRTAGGAVRIGQESRGYYVLGYNPGEVPRDGKFRKIEVKVRGKGLTVRALCYSPELPFGP